MTELVGHLNTLTSELAPAVKAVGPKLPNASLRALEALDEAVVILKAMQKSFLLSGKVQDVREEEALIFYPLPAIRDYSKWIQVEGRAWGE